MRFMAVALFALACAAAVQPAAAQSRPGPFRGVGAPQDYRRVGPEFPHGPAGGGYEGPRGPIGGPYEGPRGPRAGPDSLGADWGPQQDEAFEGVRQRRYVPLARAIEQIRRRTPGGQLDAGLEQWAGRPAYRIRWATPDGRRIDYMVDAETGAILGPDGR